MTNRTSYLLSQDDEGHWYLFPKDKQKEFEQWVQKQCSDDADGEYPEWLKDIDGPHRLLIYDYEEV